MRIIIASLVAAIVLFFCGFLWWGMLMPIIRPAKVITDSQLIEKMSSTLDESAIYMYPDYSDHSEDASGPMAILFFDRNLPSMPMMMGMGLGHMFVTALMASLFVSSMRLRTFVGRLGFVFCLGLFVAVWADVGNSIWWRHPLSWTAFHFGYDAVSWLLAGIVIAAIVKPDNSGTPSEK